MINMSCCLDYTEEMLTKKDTELAAGLGVALGLMAIEMVKTALKEERAENIYRENISHKEGE